MGLWADTQHPCVLHDGISSNSHLSCREINLPLCATKYGAAASTDILVVKYDSPCVEKLYSNTKQRPKKMLKI